MSPKNDAAESLGRRRMHGEQLGHGESGRAEHCEDETQVSPRPPVMIPDQQMHQGLHQTGANDC
jgi:hypothetical protein